MRPHPREDKSYEIIKQGYFINNKMKTDIIDLYFKSLEQTEYINPSQYIRQKLEEKYGRCFSIGILSLHGVNFHSFPNADDNLFEFNTRRHSVIVYIVQPQALIQQEQFTPVPLHIQNTIVNPQIQPLIPISQTAQPQLQSQPLQEFAIINPQDRVTTIHERPDQRVTIQAQYLNPQEVLVTTEQYNKQPKFYQNSSQQMPSYQEYHYYYDQNYYNDFV